MSVDPFDSNGPSAELLDLSLTEVADQIRTGRVSARDTVDAYLARIQAYGGRNGLNAFITVAADEARAEADRLDRLQDEGQMLGPLHGVPIAVKDNLNTAGMRTTGGTRVLADHVPDEDASAVRRLKDAGAIVLGKTNMHELAFGITNNNPHYGPARNPYDQTRISGGSSGGSAVAVAAGLCAAALGTDTGGSVRIPSALCGCVGLKATNGRIDCGGLMFLSTTCDCVGPITRTAEDVALMLHVLAGSDDRDGDAADRPALDATVDDVPWEDVRLGVLREYFYEDNDSAVTTALKSALDRMASAGAGIVEVQADGLEELLRQATPTGFALVLPESVHLINRYLETADPPRDLAEILEELGPDVQAALGSQIGSDAAPVPGHVYFDAVNSFQPALRSAMEAALQDVDALVTPTTPLPAAPIGDDAETMLNGRTVETFNTFIRYTFPVNMAGLPAITVPAGTNDSGLPIGMQFIGPAWEEKTLLRLAHAWEALRT